MYFLDISDEFSINLSEIIAIQKSPSGGTKVYIGLDDLNQSFDSNIPFESFKTILGINKKAMFSIQKSLDQLAKFQTQPVP